ncbi:hypothetical protein [Bifidobacterium criceti]|uniref:Uncharacterized protein n=1 Tax=Bifidobacterium criceti TaxID=1960969 RepID=A0A2A2EEG8_9BIFI|nr:hypothetical protein [Bifidobacterium criceti]PAU67380.1 hypothetical protein B1526_1103 [Bifidobacterium criceti]
MPNKQAKTTWDPAQHPRGWAAEWFEAPETPDDGSYRIGEEIRDLRKPGPKTIGVLGKTCNSRIVFYPDLQAMFAYQDDTDGCGADQMGEYWANEFCTMHMLYDKKRKAIGLRPAFIKLYLSSHSDHQFRIRSYKPVHDFFGKEFAQNTDFGRLRARVEARLQRCTSVESGEPVFEYIKAACNAPERSEHVNAWHVLGAPTARTTKTKGALAEAGAKVTVSWPTEEEVRDVDRKRAALALEYDPKTGMLYQQRGPRYTIGKNGAKGRMSQLDAWLLAVLTAAEGSMTLSEIVEVMLIDHPYLAPDHQVDMHMESLEFEDGTMRTDVEMSAYGRHVPTGYPDSTDPADALGFYESQEMGTREQRALIGIIRAELPEEAQDLIDVHALPPHMLRGLAIEIRCRRMRTTSKDEIIEQLESELRESMKEDRS